MSDLPDNGGRGHTPRPYLPDPAKGPETEQAPCLRLLRSLRRPADGLLDPRPGLALRASVLLLRRYRQRWWMGLGVGHGHLAGWRRRPCRRLGARVPGVCPRLGHWCGVGTALGQARG